MRTNLNREELKEQISNKQGVKEWNADHHPRPLQGILVSKNFEKQMKENEINLRNAFETVLGGVDIAVVREILGTQHKPDRFKNIKEKDRARARRDSRSKWNEEVIKTITAQEAGNDQGGNDYGGINDGIKKNSVESLDDEGLDDEEEKENSGSMGPGSDEISRVGLGGNVNDGDDVFCCLTQYERVLINTMFNAVNLSEYKEPIADVDDISV